MIFEFPDTETLQLADEDGLLFFRYAATKWYDGRKQEMVAPLLVMACDSRLGPYTLTLICLPLIEPLATKQQATNNLYLSHNQPVACCVSDCKVGPLTTNYQVPFQVTYSNTPSLPCPAGKAIKRNSMLTMVLILSGNHFSKFSLVTRSHQIKVKTWEFAEAKSPEQDRVRYNMDEKSKAKRKEVPIKMIA